MRRKEKTKASSEGKVRGGEREERGGGEGSKPVVGGFVRNTEKGMVSGT